MSDEPPRNVARLEQTTTFGVVVLAAGSFVLSYDALHQLAVANQVPRPLAWIWPLIVDGFIITASLAVLHAVLRGRSARYPWLLVLGFSTMSVTFNVLHAPATAVARLVAAVPPLTLVLSFELLMRQLRDRLAISSNAQSMLEPPPETARRADPSRTTELPGVRPPIAAFLSPQARQIHDQHRRDGANLTGRKLGQLLGVSDGYGRRLLRDISAAPSDGPSREAVGT